MLWLPVSRLYPYSSWLPQWQCICVTPQLVYSHLRIATMREVFPWQDVTMEWPWYYLLSGRCPMPRLENSWIRYTVPVSFLVKQGGIRSSSMSGWILYFAEPLSRTSKVSYKTRPHGSSQKSVQITEIPFKKWFDDCIAAWERCSHHWICEKNPPISGGPFKFSFGN